jgi:hypothetical protein
MYKTCSDCGYFTDEVSEITCPTCSGGLRFTMLPPAGVGVTNDENLSAEEVALMIPRTESVELPPAVRLAQIGTGIVIFLAVSRWGSRILMLLIGPDAEVTTQGQVVYLFAYTAFLYIAAALSGGAVAGAWSVNWVPQGIGVGIGVLALPLLLLILYRPDSLPIYLIGVLVTTAFTVLGAFVGHKLIRPSQFYT